MKTKLSKLVLAIGATILAGSAMAESATSTLGISATVENNCAISSGTAGAGTLKMNLDAIAGTAGTTADKDFSSGSTISVICTKGADASFSVGFGANGGGTARKMKSGSGLESDTLAYELYADVDRKVAFSSNPITYTGTGKAETDKTVIYGRITGADLALAPKGVYSDSVTLTVTYAL